MGNNQQMVAFLHQLLELIQDRVKYTQRHVGHAWPAGRTLQERIGSCRDLAMLMVACCRVVGLPARLSVAISCRMAPSTTTSRLDEVFAGAGWPTTQVQAVKSCGYVVQPS